MATVERNEELNESWVDLSGSETGHTEGSIQSAILAHGGDLERLLIEAQRESAQSSRRTSNKSSRKGSPKSPHSPAGELVATPHLGSEPIQEKVFQEISKDEWIWNWSSRPDILPQSDPAQVMKHPISRPRLSMRNTRVMKNGTFFWENLPVLLVTHACSFMLGAAVHSIIRQLRTTDELYRNQIFSANYEDI